MRRYWIHTKVTLSLSCCYAVKNRSKVNRNVLTMYTGKIMKTMAITTTNPQFICSFIISLSLHWTIELRRARTLLVLFTAVPLVPRECLTHSRH